MKKTNQDAWERLSWIWHAAFAVSIAVPVIVVIVSDIALPVTGFVLVAVLPLWHWIGLWLAYRNLDSWEKRHWSRLLIIAGDIAIWFVLVQMSPVFHFLLFGFFGQIFRHLHIRYAAVAVGVLVLVILSIETVREGEPISIENPLVWVFLLMGLAGIVLGVYVSSIVRQSIGRKELIAQLETTQSELAVAARREAMLEERQRLAREIHDTLAQGFTSIVLHLETAMVDLEQRGDDSVRPHVQSALDTSRRSLDEARRVVRDLRPDLLEAASLVHAVERLAARWEREHGISATVSVTGTIVELGGDREVVLFRAAEEALANVMKHAGAASVRITLSYMDDTVVLDVNDDGKGFDPGKSTDAQTFGITGMRERAMAVGGSVELESSPGSGTTVMVALPIEGRLE